MYMQSAFEETRLEVQHGLIQACPLATLIVQGEQGPTADLIPFMLYPGEGEAGLGVLRAHVARGNPVWRALAAAPACLVVFHGAEQYISPGWYETKQLTHKVVPTWNYATVQVRGAVRVVEDSAWLRRQLDDLTASQEGRLPAPWKPSDAPADFLEATMKAIIGIEIPIAEIAGKWKVSQNRDAADQRGVAANLLAQQPPAVAMAALVAGGRPK